MELFSSWQTRARVRHSSLLLALMMAVVDNRHHHSVSCFSINNSILLPSRSAPCFTTTTTYRPVVGTKHLGSPLCAKKQQSKKGPSSKQKSGNNSGGGSGFGAATATTKTTTASKTTKKRQQQQDNDDCSLFPALEPHVLKTMIPAERERQSMSPDIYQRLDQIYGLPDFNYEATREKKQSINLPMTLSDLILSSPSSSASASSLDSLLVGKDVKEPTTPGNHHTALQLEQLPAWKDEDLQVLHVDPLVLSIRNFFTHDECDRYRVMSATSAVMHTRSPTVGKDAVARAQRTSTTWYHYYQHVPELMAKASRLLGLRADDDIGHWEEAQTVRYRSREKFTWHLDALGPNVVAAANNNNKNNKDGGGPGQRIATLIVYLTDLEPQQGGATMFRDLTSPPTTTATSDAAGADDNGRLSVRPQKGSALLFFPAAGGIPNAPIDFRTLHCGQQVVAPSSSSSSPLASSSPTTATDSGDPNGDKWIAQLWLRQGKYTPTAPSTDNTHDSAAVQQAIAAYCATRLAQSNNIGESK
jgi:2OG-Fe(II) oxygenase superfamily